MCVGSIELLSRLQWESIPPRRSRGEVSAWEVRQRLRAGGAGVGAACAGLGLWHHINSLFLWFVLEGELGKVLFLFCFLF